MGVERLISKRGEKNEFGVLLNCKAKSLSNSCYRSCAHGQSLLCLQLRADEAYGSVQRKMTL